MTNECSYVNPLNHFDDIFFTRAVCIICGSGISVLLFAFIYSTWCSYPELRCCIHKKDSRLKNTSITTSVTSPNQLSNGRFNDMGIASRTFTSRQRHLPTFLRVETSLPIDYEGDGDDNDDVEESSALHENSYFPRHLSTARSIEEGEGGEIESPGDKETSPSAQRNKAYKVTSKHAVRQFSISYQSHLASVESNENRSMGSGAVNDDDSSVASSCISLLQESTLIGASPSTIESATLRSETRSMLPPEL